MGLSLEFTGNIVAISETTQVTEKFQKRDLAVQVDEEYNGNTYSQFLNIQAKQTKCALLDGYKVGDPVKVGINIRGNRNEKDGNVRYFNSLDLWKIEKDGSIQEPQPEVKQAASHSSNGSNDADDIPF